MLVRPSPFGSHATARRGAMLFLSVGTTPRGTSGSPGIDQSGRRGRELLRLHAGAEAGDRVVLIDERRRQFVAHAEVQRQLRGDAELVLRVTGEQPAIAILDGLLRGGARLRRAGRAGSRPRRCR